MLSVSQFVMQFILVVPVRCFCIAYLNLMKAKKKPLEKVEAASFGVDLAPKMKYELQKYRTRKNA